MIWNKNLCIPGILIFCLLFSGHTKGQYIDLSRIITINQKNITLGKLFTIIETKGNIHLSYSPDQVDLQKQVSFSVRNKTLKYALDKLCKEQKLQYTIVEQHIVIKPAKEIPHQQEKMNRYTISGYIRDKETGERLIGASVYISGTPFGAITNAYGYYSLTLEQGGYSIKYAFMGYTDTTVSVTLNRNIENSIALEYDETLLEEVVVTKDIEEEIIETSQMSKTRITPETMEQIPGLMGEKDLIKSLQTIPGIKTYGDASASFFVRGGNKDQNLILLDEAPIYNPAHLMGFFSTFVPEAIKDIKVYKGDMPASHGGRLSSLIDIKTKDGNMKKYKVYGNLGIITSGLSVEGPVVKNKSSFFISGRKSNLNLLFRPFFPYLNIWFYDVSGKINYTFNSKNRLYVSVYSGQDNYGVLENNREDFGIAWSNIAGTIRWNHLFNDKLFSNTTVYASRYSYFLYFSKDTNNYLNTFIGNLSLKTDFTCFMNPRNTIRFGIALNGHYFNPGNHVYGAGDQDYFPDVPSSNALETVAYLSNEQKINKKFSLRYGLRMPVWLNFGPTTVYKFDDDYEVHDTLEINSLSKYNSFINLEPRISAKYTLNTTASLKASYSRTVQYIQLLSNSVSPFTSIEVFLPGGPNIKPQQADLTAAGVVKSFPKWNVDVSIEGFYKSMYNQIEYKNHPNMLFNPLIEGELRFGKAWSYGADLLIRKTKGALTGWAGYTYSRVFKKIKDINDGKKYPPYYDRPHSVNMNAAYRVSKRIKISASWTFSSGIAISTPTSFYYLDGFTVPIPIYEEKNNDRLPAYHRLDVSASWMLNKPGNWFKHRIELSVYNVYNQKNPVAVNFNKMKDTDGNFYIPVNIFSRPEVVSTELALMGIMPSINYKFTF